MPPRKRARIDKEPLDASESALPVSGTSTPPAKRYHTRSSAVATAPASEPSSSTAAALASSSSSSALAPLDVPVKSEDLEFEPALPTTSTKESMEMIDYFVNTKAGTRAQLPSLSTTVDLPTDGARTSASPPPYYEHAVPVMAMPDHLVGDRSYLPSLRQAFIPEPTPAFRPDMGHAPSYQHGHGHGHEHHLHHHKPTSSASRPSSRSPDPDDYADRLIPTRLGDRSRLPSLLPASPAAGRIDGSPSRQMSPFDLAVRSPGTSRAGSRQHSPHPLSTSSAMILDERPPGLEPSSPRVTIRLNNNSSSSPSSPHEPSSSHSAHQISIEVDGESFSLPAYIERMHGLASDLASSPSSPTTAMVSAEQTHVNDADVRHRASLALTQMASVVKEACALLEASASSGGANPR